MKYAVYLSLFYFLSQNIFSQSHFNIVCRDFTYQEKKSDIGNTLKQTFEVAISKAQYPFKIIQRDKMNILFETLQEEKNLYKDLSNEFNKKLKIVGVDYLVVGNMDINVGSGKYRLYINFIKITGIDVTEKLPMMITLTKEQLSDNEELKEIFNIEIENFVKSFFIIKDDTTSFVKIPIFFKELNKRDSIINVLQKDANSNSQTINNLSNSIVDLQKDVTIKGKEIKNLNKNINDIKEYANMAKLSVFGSEFITNGPITITSSLSLLMKNILVQKDENILVKFDDSVLNYINRVIEIFPKFPFGYWAKAEFLLHNKNESWKEFAIKAIEILQITVTIEGHNENHDQVLKRLQSSTLK